jgi:hypothetical protein
MWPFKRRDDHRSAAFNAEVETERWAEMYDIQRAVDELRLLGANSVAVDSIDRLRFRLEVLEALDGRSEHE